MLFLPPGISSLNNVAKIISRLSQFLSAAPHMVPSVSLLGTSFLQLLSGFEETEEPDETPEDTMEVDSDSSDDDTETIHTNATHANTAQLWMPSYESIKEKRVHKIVKDSLLDLHETESIFDVQ